MTQDVESTHRGGAPVGNQNAAKAKRWREAILRALSRSAGSIPAGLDKAADQLVSLAMEGDKWALDHIADRLDGKPKQETVLAGDEESGPLRVIVEGIRAAHGRQG